MERAFNVDAVLKEEITFNVFSASDPEWRGHSMSTLF